MFTYYKTSKKLVSVLSHVLYDENILINLDNFQELSFVTWLLLAYAVQATSGSLVARAARQR